MSRRTRYEDPYHKGQPGTRWSLMDRFEISRDGVPYLFRWRIVQTPWFGVFLHKLTTGDPDEHPHDHPWPFVSIVLKGGYDERVEQVGYRYTTYQRWGRWSVHTMPLRSYHRITRLLAVPTWTLVIVGRRQQDWGFLTTEGKVPWRRYLGLEDR